jgi:peptide/nickel transport system permease protein
MESLPKLVLVLLVIALFRPDIYLILLVVGVTNISSTAELLRAKIATLRRKSYIEAALALGVHPARVIGKHILWLHGRGVLLVQATVGMGEAILIETSLSYLGFGVQEPTPSWGNMVALGKDYFFRGELWVSTAPAFPFSSRFSGSTSSETLCGSPSPSGGRRDGIGSSKGDRQYGR